MRLVAAHAQVAIAVGAAVSAGSPAGLWGCVTAGIVRLYFVTGDGCSARGCLPHRVPEGREGKGVRSLSVPLAWACWGASASAALDTGGPLWWPPLVAPCGGPWVVTCRDGRTDRRGHTCRQNVLSRCLLQRVVLWRHHLPHPRCVFHLFAMVNEKPGDSPSPQK